MGPPRRQPLHQVAQLLHAVVALDLDRRALPLNDSQRRVREACRLNVLEEDVDDPARPENPQRFLGRLRRATPPAAAMMVQ